MISRIFLIVLDSFGILTMIKQNINMERIMRPITFVIHYLLNRLTKLTLLG